MSLHTEPSYGPAIEGLESRVLLSSGVVKLIDGTGRLRVACHARQPTVVAVSVAAGNVMVSMSPRPDGAPEPVVHSFAAAVVRRLEVLGGSRGDTISVNLTENAIPGVRVIVNGRGGDDVILGSAGGDFLYGGPGNDIIDGHFGQDYLSGGAGRDRLDGGREPVPEIVGREDPDTADDTRDALVGGPGFDIIFYAEEDVILPGKGANQVVQV